MAHRRPRPRPNRVSMCSVPWRRMGGRRRVTSRGGRKSSACVCVPPGGGVGGWRRCLRQRHARASTATRDPVPPRCPSTMARMAVVAPTPSCPAHTSNAERLGPRNRARAPRFTFFSQRDGMRFFKPRSRTWTCHASTRIIGRRTTHGSEPLDRSVFITSTENGGWAPPCCVRVYKCPNAGWATLLPFPYGRNKPGRR